MAKWLIICFACLCHPSVYGKDIYVNNLTGADNNTGLTSDSPFRTIAKAVSTVKPGDAIHIINTGAEYKESLVLSSVSGTPDARITIDGNGSTLSGCQPIRLSEWQQIGPGLYRNSTFYGTNRFVADFMRIYFFLFDGKMCRMGRSRKGPNADFKKPEDLTNNEWTFTEKDSTFYIRIDPSRKLSECSIEQPVRSNAVAISGSTSYITIKN